MAMGWLSALQVIPWGDVIEHAPQVLKGARKLLDRQRHRDPADGNASAPTPGEHWQALAQQQATLQADLAQLTATVAELAEQNARLVAAVDRLRVRTRWLGAAWLVAALAGVGWLARGV